MTDFLCTYLSFTDRLSHIGTALTILLDTETTGAGASDVAMHTQFLARIEKEIAYAEARNRRLRRFEEEVKRFLRRVASAREGGEERGQSRHGFHGRRDAIQRCRERYWPFLGEEVRGLNLARGRVGILEVDLKRRRGCAGK